MKKRLFCMLLALAMCLTLLPTAALADAPADGDELSPADPVAETPAEVQAEPADPVAEVQQMIDALPTAAEVAELGADDRDAAYLAAQDACDAMDALTGEQQAQLTGLDKLEALLEWFNGQIMTTGNPSILTVGTTKVDTSDNASGDGWTYDHSSNTLTLNGYNSGDYYKESEKDTYKKKNYLGYRAMPGSTTCMAYCCIYADGDLNIDLRGTNKIQLGNDQTKYYDTNRYAWTSNSDKFSPGYVGICTTGNLSIKGYGSDSLAISAGLYAIRSGGSLTVDNATLDLSCTRDCVFINSNITIKNKSNVTATATGNQLAYFGIGNNGTLAVDHAAVTGITYGKEYESKEPAGITSIGKITVRNSGKLTGKSYDKSGSGIYGGSAIELDTYGEAYGYAYGTTSHYGIFVNTALTINQTAYLYAETKSTDAAYDALIFSSSLTQTGSNGATANVITKVNDEIGTYARPCQVSGSAYTIKKFNQDIQTKKVEITGIRRCYLYLSTYTATASKGDRTYLFTPDTSSIGGYTYAKKDSRDVLDLGTDRTEANGNITTLRRSDVALCKGIIVDSGSHTIILPEITRSQVTDTNGNPYNPLSGSFITVKSGATLTVKLNGASYLEYHSNTPLIKVESGGTLIIEAEGADGALSLINGTGKAIEAESGANITINSGTIFTGKYVSPSDSKTLNVIGGDVENITITVNGGYVESDLKGDLVVNGGTISTNSKYYYLTAPESSFVNTITVTGGSVGMKVVDSTTQNEISAPFVKNGSGIAVYRTAVTLLRAIDLTDADRAQWKMVQYRTSTSTDRSTMVVPIIQSMDLDYRDVTYTYGKNDLYGSSILANGSSTIYLYLPDGYTVNDVLIQTELTEAGTGQENNPFTSDLSDSIVSRPGGTSGTLAMRTMVLGKWIMALRQYGARNVQMCPVYDAENETNNLWYTYDPDNDLTVGNVNNNNAVSVDGFGIRALSGTHSIIVKKLTLYGENQRLQVDSNTELNILLYGESSFTANDTNTVITMYNGSELNLTGSYVHKDEGKQYTDGWLTLKGSGYAFPLHGWGDASGIIITTQNGSCGSLSLTDCVLANECTGQGYSVAYTNFDKLTFTNATAINLGDLRCNNIVIDGGSVDLGNVTSAKDSSGRDLTKIKFKVNGINTYTKIDALKVESNIADYDYADDQIWTDQNGYITLWFPAGTSLTSATIGDTTYYATTDPDGNNVLSTEKAPEFSAPSDNTTLLHKSGDSFTLTAAASGAPTPTYQWQFNRGSAWENITGATSSTYTGSFTDTMDGWQYRCVAKNLAGTVESKVFTLYHVPGIATQPAGQTVKSGASATFTVTGGTANNALNVTYQWQIKNGNNWDNIEGATENSYTTSATTASMDGQQYRCIITYTHGNVTSSMTSDAAKLTVVDPPVISSAPVSQTIAASQSASFSIAATGNHDVKYQWQVNKSTDWENIEGATDSTYSTDAVTVDMDGWRYRCVVTNTANGIDNVLPSDSAELTVVGAPVITAQPAKATVLVTRRATFSVTVTGNHLLSFQWQVQKTDKTGKLTGTFEDIPGAVEPAYTTERTALAMNGWLYRCVITNTSGAVSVDVTSQEAKLTVFLLLADNSHTDSCPFEDVTADQYYYDAVLWAVENGITDGVDESHFAPAQACTRAQLAAFLYRYAETQGMGFTGAWMFRLPFTDVPQWCQKAVAWCYQKDIVQGYGNGLFGADDTVTREQVVTMLYRFAVAMAMDVTAGEDTNILSYNDAFDVSDYAVAAFQWATGAGIVQGTDGSLLPQSNCTRSQIVTMLYRLLNG